MGQTAGKECYRGGGGGGKAKASLRKGKKNRKAADGFINGNMTQVCFFVY